MSEKLPPPPIDENVDLRDFRHMPLDVARLRDAALITSVSAEEFRAAVLLWCASWHQVPAGSLPNDDRELARLAGYGFVIEAWQRVKQGALYNWILCADGRLYHPVVVEKAQEAWLMKLRRQWEQECARIRKRNERTGERTRAPSFEDWLAAQQSVSHVTSADVTRDVTTGSATGTGENGPSHGQSAVSHVTSAHVTRDIPGMSHVTPGNVTRKNADVTRRNRIEGIYNIPSLTLPMTGRVSPPNGGHTGGSPKARGNGKSSGGSGRTPRSIRNRSRAAWLLVHEAVCRSEYPAAVESKDPIAHEAVQKIGGYRVISMATDAQIPSIRARFREAYEALVAKEHCS